jgi:hypothetical protein
MKSIMIAGIILILLGLAALAYKGITYTTEEQVAKLGPLEAKVEREKTIPLPPVLGGLALAAGVVLVVLGVRKT